MASKHVYQFMSFLIITAGIKPCDAWAWGRTGHQVIVEAAVEILDGGLDKFMSANSQVLAELANTPDQAWKHTNYNEERSLHWFHVDRYRRSALADHMPLFLRRALDLVGDAYIEKNGSAVWRTARLYSQFVAALDRRDWQRSLQLAGVMSHYVGDLSQPMHASSDYDGQSIGRRGIHAYFEIKLVNKMNRRHLFHEVVARASAIRDGMVPGEGGDLDVIDLAYEEGRQSIATLPTILTMFDRSRPDEGRLKDEVKARLAHGAAVLSAILEKAFLQSKEAADAPATRLKVDEPAWIPL